MLSPSEHNGSATSRNSATMTAAHSSEAMPVPTLPSHSSRPSGTLRLSGEQRWHLYTKAHVDRMDPNTFLEVRL